MTKKSEPWYIHAILYVVIAILLVVLIKVAIIDPADHIQKEEYYRSESILRMDNIRQAQILWQKENEKYTDNLSELIAYVKNDSSVQELIVGIDTLTNRSTNPFRPLTTGEFTPDSLMFSPKSHTPYTLQIDTTVTIDTVINRRGKIVRVDTTTVIGSLYYLECPDGYGTVGDLESPTLRNTASWE
jgi:hypothetical protein